MFSSESTEILGNIHDHLAAWRADAFVGGKEELLAALRREFETLKDAAVAAGFGDVAQLSGNVEMLLAQSDAAEPDDVALLNLLEETHDGLAAELGFVPAQTREQVGAMNNLVAALLSDGAAAEGAALNVQMNTIGECIARVREVGGDALPITSGELTAERKVVECIEIILTALVRRFGGDGIDVGECDGKLLITFVATTNLTQNEIAEQAIAAGMTATRDAIGEQHLLQILTRPDADDLREVRETVRELGGLMAMQLRDGELRLQFLLERVAGINRALLVSVGEYKITFAANAVERVLRDSGDGAQVNLDGELLPVINLADALGATSQKRSGDSDIRRNDGGVRLLAVMRLAERRVALAVDAFHDLLDIKVQAAGAQLETIAFVEGIARMRDATALLMNADAFVDRNAIQNDGLTTYPLNAPAQTSATGKRRVLILDTEPCPIVIPAAMVAEIVGASEWAMDDGDGDASENEIVCGTHAWRGTSVPVINSAAAFGVNDSAAEKHLAILWPLKNTGDVSEQKPLALTAARPRITEIVDQSEHTEHTAPPDITPTPTNALGFVQLGERTAIIPDLARIVTVTRNPAQ